MSIKRPLETGLVIFVLLVSGITRFYGLDRLSLWSDELWVVMESTRGSLREMFQAVYYNDNHPPGYYLLSRYTQLLLGSSDFAIRLPSALAGVALVFATYRIGKIHFTSTAGLVAAGLVAGSYQAIYYSQEARPNVFVALFALLALHYFWQITWHKKSSQKNAILFGLSAACAMYFHYAGLVFVLCLVLAYTAFLWREKNTAAWLTGLKLFLPAVILFSPWIIGTYYDLMFSPPEDWQRKPDLETLEQTFRFLFGPDPVRVWFYAAVLGTTIIYVAAGFISRCRQSSNKKTLPDTIAFAAFLIAIIFLPVTVFFLKSEVSQSAYNHRHFLFVIAPGALLAGFFMSLGLNRFTEVKQKTGLLLVLVLIVAYQLAANKGAALYSANHFKQEYRESALVVVNDKNFMASDRTALVSNLPFFDHYLKRFSGFRISDVIYETENQFAPVKNFITSHRIVEFYYLEAPIIPGANDMITQQDMTLTNYYRPLCRTRFARAQVIKFSNLSPLDVNWKSLPACP